MINDFSNIEIAGLSKLVLYENKGIIYNYPSIADITNIDNIANAGTIDTIDFCEGLTFKREISLGNNYKSLKNDTITFFLKNFNSTNRATYNRLLQNRNGYICELTFLSGEVLILNNAMFFNADLTKKANENFVSLEGNYRVGSNKADLTKSVRDSFTEEWFATLTSYENNIVYGAAGIQNGKYLNSNCLETDDGITILEHASITASTTLVSNKGTATASTINFYDGGIEIYAGTLTDFVLSNGSRYACSEGNGLICYDVVNSNDLTINRGLLDGFSSLVTSDSGILTAINGNTKGRVDFVINKNVEIGVIYALSNSTNPSLSSASYTGNRFQFIRTDENTYFFTFDSSLTNTNRLNFFTETTNLIDGDVISFIIDNVDNRILINGVDNGQTFNYGTATTAIFFNENVTEISIGRGVSSTQIKNLRGIIKSVTFYDTDLTTVIYSATTEARTFSASATTVYNEGTGYVFDVWKFQDIAHYNEAFGFDLYESETVSGKFLRVPKKINGTSISPTIAGYIYEKTIGGGSGFNDCETKFQLIEPIAQEIIDADIYAFFQTLGAANILTYSDFLDYVQTNISVIYSNNIISSVQLS